MDLYAIALDDGFMPAARLPLPFPRPDAAQSDRSYVPILLEQGSKSSEVSIS
jgi:hypothetical protein